MAECSLRRNVAPPRASWKGIPDVPAEAVQAFGSSSASMASQAWSGPKINDFVQTTATPVPAIVRIGNCRSAAALGLPVAAE